MKRKGNLFSKLISMITYKEQKKVKEFYVPEINEANAEPWQNTAQKSNKSEKNFRNARTVKTPIPAAEYKKVNRETSKSTKENGIFDNIEMNMEYIKKQFNYPANMDIVIREFNVAKKHKAFIAYIEGMVDRAVINNFILRPLLNGNNFDDTIENSRLYSTLESVIEINRLKKLIQPEDMITEILSGNTCLYVDGCDYYVSCATKGYEKRGVDKPQIEGVVKGAQEGFNENLRTNITLIRRIVKNKNLTTEMLSIGDQNNNQCAIMYLNGIVNPAIITEVKRRINGLKTDYIAGSGMLEQFIEDSPMAIIPTVLSTERPDRASASIMEGRVAIIAEGTPFAIIAPITIYSLLNSPEDTSLNWQYGTLLRFVRTIAIFVSVLLPGFYVAMTNFHREMIPTDLLVAIAQARENVPFPTIVEVLLMEASFELIREAGIRVPGIIGNTIGIIGALILGQAAVQANLVSPVLIIIVAFTGLGNFTIPDYSLAFAARIVRVVFIVLGALLGFYGISLGMVGLMAVLVNIKSFGVPMFATFAPRIRRRKDALIVMPVWKQELRPDEINPQNERIQPEISKTWTLEDADVPNIAQNKEDSNE